MTQATPGTEVKSERWSGMPRALDVDICRVLSGDGRECGAASGCLFGEIAEIGELEVQDPFRVVVRIDRTHLVPVDTHR